MEENDLDESGFDTKKPKLGGLRRLPHAITKESLFERNIDLQNIMTIIGPRYVLKDISAHELPSLEPPHIQTLNKYLGGLNDGQDTMKVYSQEEIIEMESRRLLRFGKSRFSSSKARRKKIPFKRKKKIKRIRRFIIHLKQGQQLMLFSSWKSILTPFKLIKWRKESHHLPKIINDEINLKIKPTIGLKPVKISSLRSLERMSRTPFLIVNTTERLDHNMPNRSQPTVLLQWGRARPSIRDIRVDGVKTDHWFVNLVHKMGARLNSVWSQWLTILGGLLLIFMAYVLIF